jgi:hypothetical protein
MDGVKARTDEPALVRPAGGGILGDMAPGSPPVCPVCSKAIRSGTLVLFEDGEFFHVRCRSRTLELTAMDEVDRARTAKERAVRLLEDARRRRARAASSLPPHVPAKSATCPVCGEAATLTDWRPSVDWVAIENCSCQGYFLWAGVLEKRLPALAAAHRQELAARIRKVRAMGREAWCTTDDGTVQGPLVVRMERPDRRS